MLMLGVKPGDYVMIGDDIKVRVVEAGAVFRLGIEAPRDMLVLRKNLFEESNPDARDEDYVKSKRVTADELARYKAQNRKAR